MGYAFHEYRAPRFKVADEVASEPWFPFRVKHLAHG